MTSISRVPASEASQHAVSTSPRVDATPPPQAAAAEAQHPRLNRRESRTARQLLARGVDGRAMTPELLERVARRAGVDMTESDRRALRPGSVGARARRALEVTDRAASVVLAVVPDRMVDAHPRLADARESRRRNVFDPLDRGSLPPHLLSLPAEVLDLIADAVVQLDVQARDDAPLGDRVLGLPGAVPPSSAAAFAATCRRMDALMREPVFRGYLNHATEMLYGHPMVFNQADLLDARASSTTQDRAGALHPTSARSRALLAVVDQIADFHDEHTNVEQAVLERFAFRLGATAPAAVRPPRSVLPGAQRLPVIERIQSRLIARTDDPLGVLRAFHGRIHEPLNAEAQRVVMGGMLQRAMSPRRPLATPAHEGLLLAELAAAALVAHASRFAGQAPVGGLLRDMVHLLVESGPGSRPQPQYGNPILIRSPMAQRARNNDYRSGRLPAVQWSRTAARVIEAEARLPGLLDASDAAWLADIRARLGRDPNREP